MGIFNNIALKSVAWGFLNSVAGTSYRSEKGLAKIVSAEDLKRVQKYSDFWDFYEGYHWQKLGGTGGKMVHTENWCRRFVNKFVYTELNGSFRFKFAEDYEKRILPFLNSVWEDNHKEALMQQVGQNKSVTGDAYIHVVFERPGTFDDPYSLYPKGRIRLLPVPSGIVFPRYADGYDAEALESVAIIYPQKSRFDGAEDKWIQFIYTKDKVTVIAGESKEEYDNIYGVIPVFHFRNLPVGQSNFGVSDLEDIIPLNTQLNLKNGDVSEIIDYHSAPITVIYGASISNLERGANKIWGGLPKDAKVENLELTSDLSASTKFIERLEDTMYKISGVPPIALGGTDVNSNVSGYAINLAMMPLTDTVIAKRQLTGEVIEAINKLILKIGITEGLLEGVGDIPVKDLYLHTVEFGGMIPRDSIRELEQLQAEFKLGLVDRREAMARLGKPNIEESLTEIDKERKEKPFLYGKTAVAMPTTSRLVDTETGDILLKGVKPLEPVGNIPEQNSNFQDDKHSIGKNKEGKDLKINSGVNNKVVNS